MAPTTELRDTYRMVGLRLRVLLLGDGIDSPGFVKGDDRRLRVEAGLGHLREAFDAALEREAGRADLAEAHVRDLEEELRRLAASGSRAAPVPALLTPAEVARRSG